MEVVNTLDIDGSQWELQDVEARNRIAEMEQLLKTENVNDIQIVLNSGNSASEARITSIQKFGKIYIGLIIIENLTADNIGTLNRVNVGTVNTNVLNNVYSIGFDYHSGKNVRIRISPEKIFSIEESSGVSNGNNGIRASITWIEP